MQERCVKTLSMYVCMHACLLVRLSVCLFACLPIYVCMHACMPACPSVCMFVCLFVCFVSFCFCMYVCKYVCMYVCVCVRHTLSLRVCSFHLASRGTGADLPIQSNEAMAFRWMSGLINHLYLQPWNFCPRCDSTFPLLDFMVLA